MTDNSAADANEIATWALPRAVFRLSLTEVSSYLIITQRRRLTKSGSLADLEAFYKKVRVHNLLLGWWGIPFGLVWTPLVLSRNAKANKTLGELGQSGKAAANWYPDPSGRNTSRYFDGATWTDQVRTVTTEAPPTST